MRQALRAFAPVEASKEEAITAAIAAGERFLVGLGMPGGARPESLRKAAEGIWSTYCNQALESFFVCGRISRQDLVDSGATEEEALCLDDTDMEEVASRMERLYVEFGSYWQDLEQAVNEVRQKKGLLPIHFLQEE